MLKINFKYKLSIDLSLTVLTGLQWESALDLNK